MAGIYAADGSINVTVVPGTVITGAHAADGSRNVFQVTGASTVGLYHPCGAYNVFRSLGTAGHQHVSGARNISKTGGYIEGTVKVTVVSGVIT